MYINKSPYVFIFLSPFLKIRSKQNSDSFQKKFITITSGINLNNILPNLGLDESKYINTALALYYYSESKNYPVNEAGILYNINVGWNVQFFVNPNNCYVRFNYYGNNANDWSAWRKLDT